MCSSKEKKEAKKRKYNIYNTGGSKVDESFNDFFVLVKLKTKDGEILQMCFKTYIDWVIYRIYYKLPVDAYTIDFIDFVSVEDLE